MYKNKMVGFEVINLYILSKKKIRNHKKIIDGNDKGWKKKTFKEFYKNIILGGFTQMLMKRTIVEQFQQRYCIQQHNMQHHDWQNKCILMESFFFFQFDQLLNL